MPLTLEIVSAKGVECSLEGLERIVVRRREPREPGSEVAICPHHAPLLMQIQPCVARVTSEGETRELELAGGVLEVCRDRVTIALT